MEICSSDGWRIAPLLNCRIASVRSSTCFDLLRIVVGLLYKQIHNNPQQIKQAEFERLNTELSFVTTLCLQA